MRILDLLQGIGLLPLGLFGRKPEGGRASRGMGRLYYADSDIVVEFDDRTLAHLQIVVRAKLRQGTGFFFSWQDDPSVGSGRSSIWLDSSIPLCFLFTGRQRQEINDDWLHLLMLSANQTTGLQLLAEPGVEEIAPLPICHIHHHHHQPLSLR